MWVCCTTHTKTSDAWSGFMQSSMLFAALLQLHMFKFDQYQLQSSLAMETAACMNTSNWLDICATHLSRALNHTAVLENGYNHIATLSPTYSGPKLDKAMSSFFKKCSSNQCSSSAMLSNYRCCWLRSTWRLKLVLLDVYECRPQPYQRKKQSHNHSYNDTKLHFVALNCRPV